MSIYRYPGPFGWKDDAIAQAFFITKEEEPKDQADIDNLTVSKITKKNKCCHKCQN